jgi:hypothetical protein
MKKKWEALGEMEQKMCKQALGVAFVAIGIGASILCVGIAKRKRGDK